MAIRKVRCPQCASFTEYRPENPYRPFCSERCKLIDLGAWAEERYAIAGAEVQADALGGADAEDEDGAGGGRGIRLDS